MMPRVPTAVLVIATVLGLSAADKSESGGQLRQLRFSWDGKYVLTQDDSEITVLAASSLDVLFRIPAENATLAQFSPDSREVVFVSSITRADADRVTVVHTTPHVEHWSVGDWARIAFLALPQLTCGTVALTLDGRFLACVDFEGTLRVIDVASTEPILEMSKFVRSLSLWVGVQRYDFETDLGNARLAFSPEGRFLIAAAPGGTGAGKIVVWDTGERRLLGLKGRLGTLRNVAIWNMQFTFLGQGRLAISCGVWQKRFIVAARIVPFPDGNTSSTLKIPWGPQLWRAADPAFLIVIHPYHVEYEPWYYGSRRVPVPSQGAAAVELATGQMIVSDTPALDVFANHYIAEVRPGDVGLYERGKGLQSSVVLHKK
jgi:hypothetical protein